MRLCTVVCHLTKIQNQVPMYWNRKPYLKSLLKSNEISPYVKVLGEKIMLVLVDLEVCGLKLLKV